MKKTLPVIIAALMCTPVLAEDIGAGFDLGANVSVVTNYVWRGVTQTDEEPAIQGGFDLSHETGLYIGNWNSNVDGGIEMDFYGGFSTELFDLFTIDVGAIQYYFPGQSGLDTYEFYGGISSDIGPVTPSIKVSYDPDLESYYVESGASVSLPLDLSLDAHYGTSIVDEGPNNDDWSVGLGYNVFGVDLNMTYTDSDADDSYVWFGISKSF